MRVRSAGVFLAAPLVLLAFAGCAGLQVPACVEEPSGLHTPWVDESFLDTDPRQAWDTVVLQHGGEDPVLTVHPDQWQVEAERVSPPEPVAPAPAPEPEPEQAVSVASPAIGPRGPKAHVAKVDLEGLPGNFSILRVTPSGAGGPGGKLALAYDLGGCDERQAGTITWDLAAPKAGPAAQPGQGTHVYTAGFWENGTLFYTNIAAVDHGDWPRAGWYAWEGGEPLPVYVYDEDRNEEPPYWRPPSSNLPSTGTPADPVVHEAGGELDVTTRLGYYTTIPGFNEALKGLSTSTTRVVRLTPEEAYTRAGNEAHPLYGDALVFYIKVVHVVDLPCPPATADLCGGLPVLLAA